MAKTNNNTRRPRLSKGFTLVELSAVLLILAIAAAAVTLNFRPPLYGSQMLEVAGQVDYFDQLTRNYARQHDRTLRLTIDLNSNQLTAADCESGKSISAPFGVPHGWRMTKAIIRDQAFSNGTGVIGCSRQGLTASYALRLEKDDKWSCWLVVAGLSGQVTQAKDEKQVTDIMATAQAKRDDSR